VMELLVASRNVADTQKHRHLFMNEKRRDQFEFTIVTVMNFVSFILDKLVRPVECIVRDIKNATGVIIWNLNKRVTSDFFF